LRVKQDAVPGLVIPIIVEVLQPGPYEWVCAELCGWGHYKMKARVLAEPKEKFEAYLKGLEREQFDDGVSGQAGKKGAPGAAKPAGAAASAEK
jgi:cytochrome c oxidase subunit 2